MEKTESKPTSFPSTSPPTAIHALCEFTLARQHRGKAQGEVAKFQWQFKLSFWFILIGQCSLP